MFFNKKEPTVESLMKKCNEKYRDFTLHLSQAHFQAYYDFKTHLNADFMYLRTQLALTESEPTVLSLLKKFDEQLTFINKHPFSTSDENVADFIKANYPYQEKIQEVIKNSEPAKMKLK
jgi:hypothetical protein